MRAVKANREYTITEAEKDFYQKQGFDIIGDDGNVVQYGAGKTVPYEQYAKLHGDHLALQEKVKALQEADTDKLKKEEIIELINALKEE